MKRRGATANLSCMRWRRIVIPAAVMTAAGGTAAVAAGLYAARKLTGLLVRPAVDLRDKVVLITGGSRGLGLAMTREFAKAGCRIAICARDRHELDEAGRRLHGAGREVATFVCDVTHREDVAQMVREVVEHFGRIDILVNNAGEIRVAPVESLDRGDFESAMATMFWGPVDMTLEVLPHMRRQRRGQIVNVTSIGGRVSVPRLIPYCCAKFAFVAFSDGLAAELDREGIRVLTVVPGLMRTGSYLQAQFKGDAAHEFTWFGLAANLPGFTVPAQYAARKIRRAVEAGRFTLTITWPAKLLLRMQTLFPEITRHLMAGVNEYVLPYPEGTKTFVTGKVLNQSFKGIFRLFTTLGRSAASELNQG
jgi:NAD(P)-dependent dehydrogenase (short-subunit alcohol dehydrogenase family)